MMHKEPISKVPDNDKSITQTESKKAPLYWTRMLRFSIYFTLLGVILCFLLVFAGRNAAAQTADPMESVVTSLETLIFSSKFLLIFLSMGVTSIIISAIMRYKEKRHRDAATISTR